MKVRTVSIILPVLNEEKGLVELQQTINKIATEKLKNYRVETIYINDGSTDNSAEIIKNLAKKDNNIGLINLRIHMGKSTAMNAGFAKASGEIIVTMDSDLQDRPENLPAMINKLDEGWDMVVGWKKDRKDPMEKRVMSYLFNKWVQWTCKLHLHDMDCGLKVMKREVIEEVELYGQLHRYFPVLAAKRGFKITEIPVTHAPRKHGKSKYGWGRVMMGGLDFITIYYLNNYADRPLHFFGIFGLVVSVIGILLGVYLSVLHFQGQKIGDRPLLILAVLLMLVGLQVISKGLLAEMLTRQNRMNLKLPLKKD